jgi:CHAD domain-containing protein
MTYRFKLREPVAEGIQRIGLAQIEMAEARLACNDDVPTAVHDARRCLKRLRALLRLIRPALSETIYERETKRLSGIGRLLSGERDRHVMQQTLLKLESQHGALPNDAGKHVRTWLAQPPRATGRGGAADVRRKALTQLKPARKAFAGPHITDVELTHLLDGLELTYRKARRAFHKAYEQPSDESFHHWRKTVQQHWRHMQLLSRGWPEALSARAGEAKALSQILGEDHDLAVLAAFVRAHADPLVGADDIDLLETQCRASQAELRERARHHGARLFAEPAKNLKARLGAYWSAAAAARTAPAASKGQPA